MPTFGPTLARHRQGTMGPRPLQRPEVAFVSCNYIRMMSLKYGFCKKYFDRDADLEKNGGQKCSTGQRFIFTVVTFYKIHILDSLYRLLTII